MVSHTLASRGKGVKDHLRSPSQIPSFLHRRFRHRPKSGLYTEAQPLPITWSVCQYAHRRLLASGASRLRYRLTEDKDASGHDLTCIDAYSLPRLHTQPTKSTQACKGRFLAECSTALVVATLIVDQILHPRQHLLYPLAMSIPCSICMHNCGRCARTTINKRPESAVSTVIHRTP